MHNGKEKWSGSWRGVQLLKKLFHSLFARSLYTNGNDPGEKRILMIQETRSNWLSLTLIQLRKGGMDAQLQGLALSKVSLFFHSNKREKWIVLDSDRLVDLGNSGWKRNYFLTHFFPQGNMNDYQLQVRRKEVDIWKFII